jgi:acetylornithine/LysW-gamma-L-lysine aminotransferase
MKQLVELTAPRLKKVFLCNSGTESVEAAIKFARVSTSRPDIICAMRGFHGRTFGALSATFTKKYRSPFEPLVPGFHFVPYNNFEKLSESITPNTAAILLEPVQGEGGVYPGDPEYFKRVRDLCDQNDIILIIDEIQSGFCRTGKFFAYEYFDIEPDILCLAKALAGGIPMGAVLCSDKISVEIGHHGTTFGGNPLACAAAIASISFMLETNLASQAKEKGDYFAQNFSANDFPQIREIRQKGLMIGIELKEKSKPYINRLQGLGIIALPAGPTVLRLLPPLTIEYAQLDKVIEGLRMVFSEVL